MKMSKIFIRALVILLAAATAGLLLRAIFNYTEGKKLAEYFEQAKVDGVPLTLQELGPACDDADNAARFWKAAEAMILVKDEDKNLLNRTIEDFFFDRPLDDGARAGLSRLTEENRQALGLMSEAAGKPCFRYGDWSKRTYDAHVSPDSAVKMILAVRLLGIDAVLRGEAGKTEEALEQCRRGLAFVRRVQDEPFLITYLVSISNMKTLLVCLQRIASGREIAPDALSSVMKEADPLLWRAGMARTCQGERVLGRDELLELVKGNTEALKLGFGDRLFYWLTRPMAKSEIIRIQAYWLELEQQVRLPCFQNKEFRDKYIQKVNSLSWYEKLSDMHLPDYSSVILKEATLESLILTTRIGLACKIYKHQHGRFPENIAALVPGILTEEPLDPFTGRPFIYRSQDGGFIVYGLGSNEKDDGGRGTLKITQLVMDKDDDWAWSERIR